MKKPLNYKKMETAVEDVFAVVDADDKVICTVNDEDDAAELAGSVSLFDMARNLTSKEVGARAMATIAGEILANMAKAGIVIEDEDKAIECFVHPLHALFQLVAAHIIISKAENQALNKAFDDTQLVMQ